MREGKKTVTIERGTRVIERQHICGRKTCRCRTEGRLHPPVLELRDGATISYLGRSFQESRPNLPVLVEAELLDDLAYKLFEAVDRRGVQRVFIDGVEGFRNSAVYPERISRFMTALTVLLRAKGATVILSEELPIFAREIQTPVTELSAIVENLILMRQVELRAQLYRLISIMKLRESGYDSAIREFTISRRGIDVAASFESAEAILSGQARIAPSPKAKPGRGIRSPSRRRK